jgi:hypothetical protein
VKSACKEKEGLYMNGGRRLSGDMPRSSLTAEHAVPISLGLEG